MDGNFDMAPRIFSQIYVIRAPLDNGYVTCVYALLAGKSYEDYKECLQAVVDTCSQLGFIAAPGFVISDFEQSVMIAVREVLGQHVVHKGCFYHLTQSTWRKVG